MEAIRSIRAGYWAAAYVIATFGAIFLAFWLGLPMAWKMAAVFAPMVLLLPLIRAGEREQAANGGPAGPLKAYNRRMLLATFTYVPILLFSVWAKKALMPDGAVVWLLAVLPALPVIAMFWAIGRFIIEQSDEYLRAQMVRVSLIATATAMSVAMVWGFLEVWRLVPHVPAFMVPVVWFISLGLATIWDKVRAP